MGVLRFILAVCVLLWHSSPGVIGRFLYPTLAVQCFYAISGFLIQMVIAGRYRDDTRWHTRFYISRALRIYPLYLLFFVLSVWLAGEGQLSCFIDHRYWTALGIWLANNLTIVGQDVLRFFYLSF